VQITAGEARNAPTDQFSVKVALDPGIPPIKDGGDIVPDPLKASGGWTGALQSLAESLKHVPESSRPSSDAFQPPGRIRTQDGQIS
jgi:hypothetical protein